MPNPGGYVPHDVTLYDGRVVKSDSEDWKDECAIRDYLRTPPNRREARFENSLKVMGKTRLDLLRARVCELEPYFVLGLPSKEARNDYVAQYRMVYGAQASNELQSKAREIHTNRRLAAVAKDNE